MSDKKYDIETIRHSLSHVLAMAVLDMFPEAKLGMGPGIENGFYYDFDLPRTLIPEDLPLLEEKMRTIIKEDLAFDRYEEPKDKAIDFLQKIGQPYKVELAAELPGDSASFYKTNNFVDLCAGPHVSSTKFLRSVAFKLERISGAYWRGSEKNPMLQRIYGIAFEDKKALDRFIKNREEAEKRDHRKLGRELDLFHVDDEVGLGLVLWHPKGAMLWRVIEDFWYKEHLKNGYKLVRSPHIGNRRLWEKSGHWGFYNASMYPPLEAGQSLEDSQLQQKVEKSEQYLLKPMNCPFHIQIFNNSKHSYRELPFRWAEVGTVYRFEKTGELSGLTRVRGFTQDDAHIICRKDQVKDELKRVVDFILFMYKSFGFGMDVVNVYLSLRDPDNRAKYAGNDEGWEFTEEVLREVAKEKGLSFTEEKGEAAFYGPKLDFKVKDVLGREWQLSTLQFDFNLPERFDMSFTNEKGEEERPYVLHRALFGSFERFIGLLIEHYAGAFPVWLAPIQARVLPIADRHQEYAEKVFGELIDAGIRAEVDDRSESIGRKIREAEMQKVPFMLVVGDKEIEAGKVAVRKYGAGDRGQIPVAELINEVRDSK
ncbi:MAG: Threonine--tRNA ligase [bacterium ADurb.Bin400]|nr:MAG: Threonine--tRNA ligase [bacterium ADurb.Bin400]